MTPQIPVRRRVSVSRRALAAWLLGTFVLGALTAVGVDAARDRRAPAASPATSTATAGSAAPSRTPSAASASSPAATSPVASSRSANSPPAPGPAVATTSPPRAVYPTAATTGVPKGTRLAASQAIMAVTPGQVIDAKDITGGIDVRARDVVVKRSRIRGDGQHGIRVREGASVVVTDTEIEGFEIGIAFANWSCTRCNIHGQSQDGVKAHDNTTLQDSIIHGMAPGPGAHADGVQMQGGSANLKIVGNTIDARAVKVGSEMGNAAIFLKPDMGSGEGPVVIEGNRLAGGNYAFWLIPAGANVQRNVIFRDNVFVKDSWRYGSHTVASPITWENNTIDGDTPVEP